MTRRPDFRTRADVALGFTAREQVCSPRPGECPECRQLTEPTRTGDRKCTNRRCALDRYNPETGRQVFSC